MACDTLTWFGQGSYLNEIEKRERVIGLLEYIIVYKQCKLVFFAAKMVFLSISIEDIHDLKIGRAHV